MQFLGYARNCIGRNYLLILSICKETSMSVSENITCTRAYNSLGGSFPFLGS